MRDVGGVAAVRRRCYLFLKTMIESPIQYVTLMARRSVSVAAAAYVRPWSLVQRVDEVRRVARIDVPAPAPAMTFHESTRPSRACDTRLRMKAPSNACGMCSPTSNE